MTSGGGGGDFRSRVQPLATCICHGLIPTPFKVGGGTDDFSGSPCRGFVVDFPVRGIGLRI